MPVSRFLLTGLLLVTALSGCARKAEQTSAVIERQPVEVTPILRRDMEETLNLVGSVAANESATLRPEIAGLIRSIHFEEGQPVKRGQLLLKIEDGEVRSQLTQIEAQYRLAELNLQRAEKLGATQSNSLADIDRARSEFASAKSAAELARIRLNRTEIRAPFDGVIGSRTLSAGDYISPQSVVSTLEDLSRLKLDFQVPERFLHKVSAGTKFIVQLREEEASATSPGRVEGRVYFVNSGIDRSTRSSQAKGYLQGAPATLKPGMFANIEVVLSVTKATLTVPEGAVLATPSGVRVIVVRTKGTDKVADFVPVRLGLRVKGVVEITPLAGVISENDEVVASGVGALILFPGAVLEPRPARTDFKLVAQ